MLENSEGPVPVKNYPPIIKKIMNIIVIMLAAVIAITGIFLLVSGIWLLVDDISIGYFGFDTVFWFLAFMGTGVLMVMYILNLISMNFFKYEILAEGIRTKYPLQDWRLISWDAFQQVCVCYRGYTTRGQGTEHTAQSVVCFVKKGEKKNLYGRWKADNSFHHRSVISIDYTDELYEEVKEKCPYEVPDLRKTRLYRL